MIYFTSDLHLGHRGIIEMQGHIHACEEYNWQNKADGIKRYDVGVDANNYYPVSVKQIIEFFNKNLQEKSEFPIL